MLKRSPEKLHRIKDNGNDWDGIPDEKLNPFQRVAKATKGIVTIGNTITTVGAGLFVMGLIDYANGEKVKAVAELAGSRGADLVDGAAADATDTKGRIGRDYDPTVDAAELLVGAPVLTHLGALPLASTVIMVAPKVVDTGAAIAARARGIEVNPTESGKLGAGGTWIGVTAFLARAAFDQYLPGYAETALETVGWVGTVGGTLYKLPATADYVRAGFGPEQPPQPLQELPPELPPSTD